MSKATIRQNVSQVAKHLGRGEASVRRWIQQFGIPTIEEGGQNLLSQDMVQVLQQIRDLREQKLRAEDIELNVTDAIRQERHKLSADESQRNESPGTARRIVEELTEALAHHQEALAQSVTGAVQEASRMADRYAESQRELGRMEAMMQAMQFQLQEAQQQARLLPEKAQALQARELESKMLAQKLDQEKQQRVDVEKKQEKLEDTVTRQRNEIESLVQEKQKLEQKLQELSHQLEQKENELEQEQAKSWWNKLTKNEQKAKKA